MGVLHAFKHFLAPALGSIVLNVAMIVAGIGFAVADRPQMAVVFAVSVIVGAVVRLLILFPPLLVRGWRWRPTFDLRDTALHELMRKMLPAFFGLAIYQINIAINLNLAFWLGEGRVSYLRYSNRLMQFPLAIFATALATAILPQLTEFVLAHSRDRLQRHISFSIRLLALVYLPATVGLIVLGGPILQILFEHGAWTEASTSNTQFALALYALGLLPVGLMRILTPVYYAEKDMITPVKYGAATVAVNTLLCLALMFTPLNYGGLALASSLSAVFNAYLLYRGRSSLLGRFWNLKEARIMLLATFAAVLMGAFCYGGYHWSEGLLEAPGRLVITFLTLSWVALGAALYFALCRLFKIEEGRILLDFLLRKKKP
jgi:putative peptidoglycan lipid II flippase